MPPAAILKDGELVAAVEESKLVRRRTHWGGHGRLPEHSIATCLELAGATPEQVDAVAIVRPIPETDFHLQAARAVSGQPHRCWWSTTWRTRPRPTTRRPSTRPPC